VRFAIFILLALLAYWLLLVGWTMWRLTRPPRRTAGAALGQGRPADPSRMTPPRVFAEWSVRHRGATMPVWDIAGDDPAGPTIVFSHGWGDSRIGALSRVQALAPHASRLVAWDMAGHGDATGTCTLGTHEVDALIALLEQLAASREQPQRVVLFGWSMGAGVSLAAAARGAESSSTPSLRIVGVIAESPYRSAPTPARNVLAMQGLPHRSNLVPALLCIGIDAGVGSMLAGRLHPGFDRVAHAGRLRQLGVPVLVLQGQADPVSPLEDARAIAMASHAALEVIPGAGHFGLWTDPRFAGPVSDAAVKWLKTLHERRA
jgi:pimeloyl-ACP methyl ester carboxylesterase